jgi:hypothetical protein
MLQLIEAQFRLFSDESSWGWGFFWTVFAGDGGNCENLSAGWVLLTSNRPMECEDPQTRYNRVSRASRVVNADDWGFFFGCFCMKYLGEYFLIQKKMPDTDLILHFEITHT